MTCHLPGGEGVGVEGWLEGGSINLLMSPFKKYQVWIAAVRVTVLPDSLVQFVVGDAGSTF